MLKSSNFSKFYIGFVLFNLIFVPIIWHFQDKSVHTGVDFLSSALEATSAIVAIVFAISILVVQHAASNYTPTVLSNFKNDKKFWFTLTYGILTITLLSVSLVFDMSLLLVNLFCFLNLLGLLAVFFLYTFGKINPISIVENIQNDIVNECTSVQNKLSAKLVEYRMQQSDQCKEMLQNIPQITTHATLTSNPDLTSKIMTYELTLRQIVVEAEKKGDYDTCRSGLDAYPKLFKSYLNIIPNFSWNQDEFLTKRLEGLKSYANMGFQNNDVIFLEDLISVIGESGEVFVKNIQPLGGRYDSNSQLNLCIYYLRDIANISLQKELWDITGNAVRAMARLGDLAFSKYSHDHLAIYFILSIAKEALRKNDLYIAQIAAFKSFEIIQTMIKNRISSHIIKQQISDLSEMLQLLAASKINTMSITGLFLETAQSGPLHCVKQCLHLLDEEHQEISTRSREELEKAIITSLIELIGDVGCQAIKNNDRVFAQSCADCLVQVSGLISRQRFQTIEEGHAEELKAILLSLTSLYHYDANRHTDYGDNIVQRISEVILYCLQNGFEDAAKLGIERIVILAYTVLEADEHGGSAVRTIRELNVIGCYGFAESKENISKTVAGKYLEFEKKFENKFSKTPDLIGNYSHRRFDEYDRMTSEYKPVEELERIMEPKNWNGFANALSQMRSAKQDAKNKAKIKDTS